MIIYFGEQQLTNGMGKGDLMRFNTYKLSSTKSNIPIPTSGPFRDIYVTENGSNKKAVVAMSRKMEVTGSLSCMKDSFS